MSTLLVPRSRQRLLPFSLESYPTTRSLTIFIFSPCRSERGAPPHVVGRGQVVARRRLRGVVRGVPELPPALRQGEEEAAGGHGLRPPAVLPVHVQEAGVPRLRRRRSRQINANRDW